MLVQKSREIAHVGFWLEHHAKMCDIDHTPWDHAYLELRVLCIRNLKEVPKLPAANQGGKGSLPKLTQPLESTLRSCALWVSV